MRAPLNLAPASHAYCQNEDGFRSSFCRLCNVLTLATRLMFFALPCVLACERAAPPMLPRRSPPTRPGYFFPGFQQHNQFQPRRRVYFVLTAFWLDVLKYEKERFRFRDGPLSFSPFTPITSNFLRFAFVMPPFVTGYVIPVLCPRSSSFHNAERPPPHPSIRVPLSSKFSRRTVGDGSARAFSRHGMLSIYTFERHGCNCFWL